MREESVRRRLRHRLKARLHEALAQVPGKLSRSLSVRVADEDHEATCRLGPVGQTTSTATVFPGLHFSPIESAIWMCLGEKALFGKEIAKHLGRGYDSEVKLLLLNLVQRRVLVHERGQGYRRAPLPEKPGQTSRPTGEA